MAGRYSADFLLHLRNSPLCVKPPGLPPQEEWMGPPPDTSRNQTKTTTDRIKVGGGDSLLLNQENRRPALDRNGTRGAANPDEIILGPPRNNFASAISARNNRNSVEPDKGIKDSERQDRSDRFSFRTRPNDSDATTSDRFRDRDGRNNFRRRGDQDLDSEGWSTVKPRKSFGTEGAERFHGRMGAAGERFGGGDSRRVRDRDDREVNDRRNRNPDSHLRDKDGDDADGSRRNGGLARGKSEPWFTRDNTNDGNAEAPAISQRERIDRAKSWRDRDPDAGDRRNDRNDRASDRQYERRWDREREQRVERDPEWLDEPFEEKPRVHTEDDMKKFMEAMRASKGGAAPKAEEKPSSAYEKPTSDNILEQPDLKVASAPAVESGPDKFFVAFGGGALDVTTPAAESKDSIRQKGAKSSRFMAFLAPQEDGRARTEPPTPAAPAQQGAPAPEAPVQNETEKQAFALLIQKLQSSGVSPAQGSGAPPHSLARLFDPSPVQEPQPKNVASPEPFQQYGGERHEDPRMRGPGLQQHAHHNMVSPRQMMPPTQPPPISRPEQVLQDLLAQRHSLPNQGNSRGGPPNPAVTSNTEFLMGLMQRKIPEPPRPELLVRMPQPTKQVSIPNIPDREPDYQREQRGPSRQQVQQQMRVQQGPPGFMDEQFHSPEMDSRPQPTQILQRPPPPGLDHHGMHPFPMGAGPREGGGGQMPQRPMIPPPGLVNGPRNVNGPMPGMFPPNFLPPGSVFGVGAPPPPPGPGPEGMVGVGVPPPGSLPRGMAPPPGFYGGPMPPFMPNGPPGMSPGGFQGGPDGPGFPGPGPSPFDRRGMMPPGAYRGP